MVSFTPHRIPGHCSTPNSARQKQKVRNDHGMLFPRGKSHRDSIGIGIQESELKTKGHNSYSQVKNFLLFFSLQGHKKWVPTAQPLLHSLSNDNPDASSTPMIIVSRPYNQAHRSSKICVAHYKWSSVWLSSSLAHLGNFSFHDWYWFLVSCSSTLYW